jgi:hypothetical protein
MTNQWQTGGVSKWRWHQRKAAAANVGVSSMAKKSGINNRRAWQAKLSGSQLNESEKMSAWRNQPSIWRQHHGAQALMA